MALLQQMKLPRRITLNDSANGVTITQSGSGQALRVLQTSGGGGVLGHFEDDNGYALEVFDNSYGRVALRVNNGYIILGDVFSNRIPSPNPSDTVTRYFEATQAYFAEFVALSSESSSGATPGAAVNSRFLVVDSPALTGATTDININVPSGALVVGAQFNVKTAITGCTSWNAAFVGGSTTSLGTGYGIAQNSKGNQMIVPEVLTAETDIRLTAVGGAASFSAGVVTGVVYYYDLTQIRNV